MLLECKITNQCVLFKREYTKAVQYLACVLFAESTEDGRVVIAGVLFSIALEIAIFSSYPAPEAHGKHWRVMSD